MAKKHAKPTLSIKDIKIGIENEDLHYYLTNHCSPDDIEDEVLKDMVLRFVAITNEIEEYLDQFDDLDDDDYSTEVEDDE